MVPCCVQESIDEGVPIDLQIRKLGLSQICQMCGKGHFGYSPEIGTNEKGVSLGDKETWIKIFLNLKKLYCVPSRFSPSI